MVRALQILNFDTKTSCQLNLRLEHQQAGNHFFWMFELKLKKELFHYQILRLEYLSKKFQAILS